MILLDTHIFVWWIHRNEKLPVTYQNYIEENISDGLGVSIISFWEISKLVEKNRLILPRNMNEWMENSLKYDGIILLELNIEIITTGHDLVQNFHKDPADQLIAATSIVNNITLLTLDKKILHSESIITIKF